MADMAPTPSPATKRPMVICASDVEVAVWIATPTVKIADQKRIEPLRPHPSEVNAWASAPTNVLFAKFP